MVRLNLTNWATWRGPWLRYRPTLSRAPLVHNQPQLNKVHSSIGSHSLNTRHTTAPLSASPPLLRVTLDKHTSAPLPPPPWLSKPYTA
jgi:hypothetical protein